MHSIHLALPFLGCTLLLAAMPRQVSAKIPEPDTILVGTLSRSNGAPIVSLPGQTLVVRAVVDGATLASTEVSAGGDGRFVLRVPMDDGVAPRLAGTAKSSDRIRVVVDNAAADLSVETDQTESGGVEIPAGRGNILSLSFSVSSDIVLDDINGNGIPDDWEEKAGLSLDRDDSALDNDGDGYSNREEWITGTDPMNENSRLAIWSVDPQPDSLRIRFAPLVGGRTYSLRRSSSLLAPSSEWSVIATFNADADMESFLWVLPVPSDSSNFYRVSVKVSE